MEAVEQTLPVDARVIKTLGDEVMVVGSDAAALTGWAVELQSGIAAGEPPPRIGIHYGEALYRDGDYYGREVNQAARVVARAGGGEVLVTRPVVDMAAGVDGLEFERIGEVSLKGFSEPTELFTASRPRKADRRRDESASEVREAVARRRPARARPAPVRGDALRRARLDLPARRGGRAARPGAVSALHVNYGLRAQADADERHCAALCEQLGVELEVVRASDLDRSLRDPARRTRRRAPPGNLQAWAREVRYAAAARMARERDALIATGHTASDQVETILYRLAASPGRRALLGMVGERGPADPPAAGRDPRADGRLLRSARAARGARTRATTTSATRARACATGWCRRCARCTRRRRRTCCRTAALLREETELLDGLVTDGARRARGASRSRACGSCPRRSRAWSWCAWPRTPPAPTCRRRASAWRRSSRSAAAAAGRSCTSAGRRAR